MTDEQLPSFLGIAVLPFIVKLMNENLHLTNLDAISTLYNSKLYSLLEKEDTKLWHYSPLTLFNMLQSEIETGEIIFPEEAT